MTKIMKTTINSKPWDLEWDELICLRHVMRRRFPDWYEKDAQEDQRHIPTLCDIEDARTLAYLDRLRAGVE